MVFLIVEQGEQGCVMLVKAMNREELEFRLNLRANEKIVASYTDNEMAVLTGSNFTVIS